MGRERVGDGGEGGLDRPLGVGGGHAAREVAAVVEAHLLGERLGLLRRQQLQRAGEQRAEQVVAPGREVQRVVEIGDAVPLGRPPGGPGAVGAADGDHEVATRGELLEVVPGHVGVELEVLRDLRCGDAVGGVADEQVDVTTGRIAEGARDRGDRSAELIGVERVPAGHGPVFYLRS